MQPYIRNALIATLLGGIGGLAKPAISQSEYVIPAFSNGVFHPGFIGSVIIGSLAAGLYWLMYGPSDPNATMQEYGKHFAASVMIGISGSGWLGSETEKNVYKKTAELASHNDPTLLPVIQTGTASQALRRAVTVSNPSSVTKQAIAPSETDAPKALR